MLLLTESGLLAGGVRDQRRTALAEMSMMTPEGRDALGARVGEVAADPG